MTLTSIKNTYLSIVCLFGMFCIFPQSNSQELSQRKLLSNNFYKLKVIEDSLYNIGEYQNLKNVLTAHIKKASALNDFSELAWPYYYHVFIEIPEIAIKYADSSIFYKKNSFDNILPGSAYYWKGIYFYELGQPDSSLSNFIRSYDIAKRVGNFEQIVDCLNGIASIKVTYGEEIDALAIHKEALKYLNNHKNDIRRSEYTKLITYENIAKGSFEIGRIDSAEIFSKKGISLAIKLGEKDLENKLRIFSAQLNYYKGKFILARDSLNNYIGDSKGASKADIYYYLGKIEGKLGNKKNKIRYYEKIDSIIGNELISLDNVNEIYQSLLQNAIFADDKLKELEYLSKLIHYDSMEFLTYKNVRNIGKREFDLPKLIEKRVELERKIENENKLKYILFFIVSLVSIAFALLVIKFYNTKKKLDKVLAANLEPITNSKIKESEIDLDSKIIEEILYKLEKWEKEKGFLNQDINQQNLSKILDTNSSYLSKIINNYKMQNFASYLKDLRVTYAVNYIKANPDFIGNKSIINIAEYFGFNSLDVFNRAFKNKIGITPAIFLKAIKMRNL